MKNLRGTIFGLIFILLFLGTVEKTWALQLRYVGETFIDNNVKFEKTTIGGLSGIAWSNSSLFALSDDKGRVSEPRLYEFEFKLEKGQVSVAPKTVHFLRGFPNSGNKKVALDPEGLVRLANGDFLISSEGDNNSKPREMPRIFRTNSEGVWKSDLPLHEKYLPEATGQQKKGIQENLAFESLSQSSNGKYVFTMTEAAIIQDLIPAEEDKGDWLRLLKFEEKSDGNYKVVAEYAYRIDSFKDNSRGKEIMRGVSEVLAISDTKLLVLERGVRIFSKNLWASTVSLYLVDLSKSADVSMVPNLGEGKFTAVDKVKLIDLETDLVKERGDKKIQNFEGLAWGPALADGRRTLIMVADNNFSKNEITEFLVFAVEGEF